MRLHKGIQKNIINTSTISTPIGEMFCASYQGSICLFSFYNKFEIEAKLDRLKIEFDAEILPSENELFEKLKIQMQEYFSNKRERFTLPLKLLGTPFQIECWKALLEIPYGKTISYKQQAKSINREKSFRAVANANGQNMLAILVPCHRVIGSDGKLHGYSGGGVHNKELLIQLEANNQND